MYRVTLTFPVAEDEEASYETLEEVHSAIRKRFPNAVYSDLDNYRHYSFPPDEKLTLVWRNKTKRSGRYGTGADSSFSVGRIIREDISESEISEMWEKFEEEYDDRQWREELGNAIDEARQPGLPTVDETNHLRLLLFFGSIIMLIVGFILYNNDIKGGQLGPTICFVLSHLCVWVFHWLTPKDEPAPEHGSDAEQATVLWALISFGAALFSILEWFGINL